MSKDVIFLHVPMLQHYMGKDVSYFLAKIAMGLFSISNELEKIGVNTEIINLGVEKVLNYDFSISSYVKEQDVKIVFMSLHWHYQTYDAIEVAKKIKEENPNVFIVFGGITASCFPSCILEKFSFVDAIIKGEGELPSVKLVQKIKNNETDFSDVPNLFWRKDGEIVENKDFWIANEDELNSYSFSNTIEKLKNWELNFRVGIELKLKNKEIETTLEKGFICCAGRGCSGNCTWCGGGNIAMKCISGRDFISLRSPKVIADEILTLRKNYGIDRFYFCYDPYPEKQQQFIELFEILGRECPKQIKITFESFSIPTIKLINSFKQNLSKDSILIISPEFAQDSLRKLHKSFYYSTDEFLNCLDYIDKNEIRSEIFFASLINEDPLEVRHRAELIERLKNTYKHIANIYVQEISDCEPFSPWAMNPEKYNLKRDLVTLEDYYNNGKKYRELW